MEPPRPISEVIEELRKLMKTGSPAELQDYVKRYPGFANGYVEAACRQIQSLLIEIQMLTLHLAKANTDHIMSTHRSDEGGIPADFSSLA